MTEAEFQEKYNLTDEDLREIKAFVKLFHGEIVSIKDIKK